MSVIVLNNENFLETIADGVTLVDMYADWCMPCKMLSPTITQLAEELEGKAKVAKLDIDKSPDIAAKYGVMSIPTVILFKDGVLVEKKVGLAQKDVYEELVQNALES